MKDYKPYYKSTVYADNGNILEAWKENIGEDDWVWYWREPWQRFSLLVGIVTPILQGQYHAKSDAFPRLVD